MSTGPLILERPTDPVLASAFMAYEQGGVVHPKGSYVVNVPT
jgi:hypothetical protein